MAEAVICEPVRTPVGRYAGVFKDTPVTVLASTVMRGLVERTGIQSSDIDDVIFGQGYANGDAAARIALIFGALTGPLLQVSRLNVWFDVPGGGVLCRRDAVGSRVSKDALRILRMIVDGKVALALREETTPATYEVEKLATTALESSPPPHASRSSLCR